MGEGPEVTVKELDHSKGITQPFVDATTEGLLRYSARSHFNAKS